MPHISYSELKDWVHCAFYHKLTRIDKIDGFKGNAFTAFGTAVHNVCEKKLLQEEVGDDYFIQQFEECLGKLDDDIEIDQSLVEAMREQGKKLLPEIQAALDDYFGEYEVLAVELPLFEPIEGEDEFQFKGYIDAIVGTPDGKVHIFDWKTCSWGWDARRKNDKMTTYQLTLYKNNKVEFFRVTSGPKKTKNALKMLNMAIYNIKNKRYIKNRLSCTSGYGCKFHRTKHCP